MKDVKFRGLTTKGEMIFGSLVTTTHGIAKMPHTRTKTWIVESAFGNGGWFNVERKQYVKPETVGQFTGLKDSEGNEIYNGDILALSFYDDFDNECVTVDHEDCPATIVKVHWGYEGYWLFSEKDSTWFFPNTLIECATVEVIGNIHQNQELMGAK